MKNKISVALALALTVSIGYIAGSAMGLTGLRQQQPAAAPPVTVSAPAVPAGIDFKPLPSKGYRDYSLTIEEKTFKTGPTSTWKAWTYSGTIPGPTLRVAPDETLRVKVTNKHTIMHSFHTHLANYDLNSDGSQANIMAAIGMPAMIHPGMSYTYEFPPQKPGLYFYHCHSSEGGFTISQHIHQGLYGAIVVEDPKKPKMREEVLFMAETGMDVKGDNSPYYIMNGMGIPGGEHALMDVYAKKGMDGVKALLGKMVPFYALKVGEPVRMHLVNIGDEIHSFHIHAADMYSDQIMPGVQWPANTVPLLPGTAESVTFKYDKPGIWLFHCHVVRHADMGMIGVFVVSK